MTDQPRHPLLAEHGAGGAAEFARALARAHVARDIAAARAGESRHDHVAVTR